MGPRRAGDQCRHGLSRQAGTGAMIARYETLSLTIIHLMHHRCLRRSTTRSSSILVLAKNRVQSALRAEKSVRAKATSSSLRVRYTCALSGAGNSWLCSFHRRDGGYENCTCLLLGVTRDGRLEFSCSSRTRFSGQSFRLRSSRQRKTPSHMRTTRATA